MSVEKRLSVATLDAGEISLGPTEAESLDLPRFSGEVACRFDSDSFVLHWHSTQRRLSGDFLSETLPLLAQVDGLLRLHRNGEHLELEVANPRNDRSATHQPRRARTAVPATASSKARRSRARPERFRVRTRKEYEWYRDGTIGLLRDSLNQISHNIADGGWDTPEMFELRQRGEELATASDFNELLALDVARVDRMPHQEATAIKVLADLYGRAVLADEVGLGKTIEAGLILKELTLRGLARRILILCPGTLREQWQEELRDKFDEEFSIIWSSARGFEGDRLIMTRELAVRSRDELIAGEWDLVIVDEAHRGTGGVATRKLLEGLSTSARYLLMLTATPVQNSLDDLFNLVQIVRPGTFSSKAQFRRQYVDRADPRRPIDPEGLRNLIRDAMVRTTRDQAGLDHVVRHTRDVPITMSETEATAYRLCTTALRECMAAPGDHLRRMKLAERLTVSPRALGISATRMLDTVDDPTARRILTELADFAHYQGMTNRQRYLLELVSQWTRDADKGKVLVFAQHTDTVEDLGRVLQEAGLEVVAYHGGMAASSRRQAVKAFRDSAQVMVSNDAGAEGLNLQFANCVVNYDLPWNPMRIEQRIGRVHRVTQTRDVHVANLFLKNTIDEHVYRILHDKLRMFELLFGQVTTILGEIGDDSDSTRFETRILEAVTAPTDKAMLQRLDRLGRDVDKAWKSAKASMDAGEHLRWLPDRSHRSEIDPRGATELKPRAVISARQRQQQVRDFVADLLEISGAEIVHREHDLDDVSTFLSAALPNQMAEGFGRGELHLAFSLEGLDAHPDAELCAAGSETFDDLIALVREQGDLLAYMPDPSPAELRPWTNHDPSVQPQGRWVSGPARFGGTATWRVRANTGGFGEQIVHTFYGDRDCITDHEPPLTLLRDGDSLEDHLTTDHGFMGDIVEAALDQLDAEVVVPAREEVMGRNRAELARVVKALDTQFAEARSAEARSQLYTARQEAERRLGHANVEIRAELLSVSIYGSAELQIEETWLAPDGSEATLSTVWDPAITEAPSFADPSGQPITTLAICGEHHACESGATTTCPSCATVLCQWCTDRLTSCHLCSVPMCSRCLDHGLICHDCSALRPATDAQRRDLPAVLRADRLSISTSVHGNVQIIAMAGHRRREVAVLRGGAVESWWTLVPDRTRASEADFEPIAESDAYSVTTINRPPDIRPRGIVLRDERGWSAFWQVRDSGGTVINHGQPVAVDKGTDLASLFAPGRSRAPQPSPGWLEDALSERLPPPPRRGGERVVEMVRQESVVAVWLDADGLHHIDTLAGEAVHSPWTEVPPAKDLTFGPWPIQPSVVLRSAVGTTVARLALLDPYRLLWLHHGDTTTLVRLDGIANFELSFQVGAVLGQPVPQIVNLCADHSGDQWRAPTVQGGERTRRVIRSVGRPRPGGSPSPSASQRLLAAAVSGAPPAPVTTEWRWGSTDMAGALRAKLPARRNEPEVIDVHLAVTDTWMTRRGPVDLHYQVTPYDTAPTVTADDTHRLATKVTFDSGGHLAEYAQSCRYCERATCTQCTKQVAPCSVCTIFVCEECAVAAAGGLHLCRACATMEPATGLRKRLRYGKSDVYRGTDAVHSVELVITDGQAALIRKGAGAAHDMINVPLTPPLQQHLHRFDGG